MARKTRCRVCHVRDVEVDGHGRCLCCRMAYWATENGMTYGALSARFRADGVAPEDFPFEGLPPVADRRQHSRYGI